MGLGLGVGLGLGFRKGLQVRVGLQQRLRDGGDAGVAVGRALHVQQPLPLVVDADEVDACNRMWARLQPYVGEAATVCGLG